MAETPLSPVLMELHSNNAVHEHDVAENSNRAIVIAGSEVVGVSLPCPTLSRLPVKMRSILTNNSDSEGEAPTGSNNAQTSGDAIDNAGVIERTVSPPPNCAICLGRCRNKCFTDSCMHQFCFKCLCEWSKVKPECPLCKQTFKSIIHNVKSIDQFEEYHVQPPTVQIHRTESNHSIGEIQIRLVDAESLQERPIFENYTALNAFALHRGNLPIPGGGVILPNRTSFVDGPLQRALIRSSTAQQHSIHLESLPWRSHIYQMKLYALPVCDITGRFRDSSARYYRNNPAQVHRLVPFIERDMQVLLRNSDITVNGVMEMITESLPMMSITSPAFRRRVRSILGDRTSHFIHEINNFARSPYDMLGYDRVVHYMPQLYEDVMIELGVSSSSSGDEDFQFRTTLPSNRNDRNQRPSNMFSVSNTTEGNEISGVSMLEQPAAINLSTHNRAENAVAVAAASASVDVIELDDDENEPRTIENETVHEVLDEPDEEVARITRSEPQILAKVNLINTSSDECEFVLARKPPHLRTPELVSLNSASDSDVQFVDETKITPANATNTDAQVNENQQQLNAVAESKTKATPKRSSRRRLRRRINRTEETSGYEGLYMGASTSSGIRSSQRKQPTTCRQRRKHEADKTSEGTELAKKGRSRSCSSTSSMSSGSSDEDFKLSQRNKSNRLTKKLTSKKSDAKLKVKSNKKPHGRKRSHTCHDSSSNINRKRKLKMQSSDNNSASSSDDDCVNLKQLKTRLTQQKQQNVRFSAGSQSTNSAGSSNSSVHVEITSSGTEVSIADDHNKQLENSAKICQQNSSHSTTSNSSSDSDMSASDESKNETRENVKSEQNSYHSNSSNSSSDSESSGTVKQHHLTFQNNCSAINLHTQSSSSSSNSLSSSCSENTSADDDEQRDNDNEEDVDIENTSLSNTDISSPTAGAQSAQYSRFSQPQSPDNRADRGEVDSSQNAAGEQMNVAPSEDAELELREEDYIWLEEILRTNGHSDLLNQSSS